MLEKVLDFKNTLMFLTDTSDDIDAHFRYSASKKHRCFFRSGHPYIVLTCKLRAAEEV
jgi:hypothetical protein